MSDALDMSVHAGTGFVPISPNPYVVGNPIRGRTMFFGRQNEFEFVRKRFVDQTLGSLLVFCGERRSGKTSILFQILEGRLGPEFIPVLIDLQSMAVSNEAAFLQKLSTEIFAAASLPLDSSPSRADSGKTPAGVFQSELESLIRGVRGRKLVLLFDEYEIFENKIDSGIISRDVLRVLASLMRRHPVFIVFTGSDHIEQRQRDYWEEFLVGSEHRRVSYLKHEDALRLIQEPVEGRVRYVGDTVDRICRLTAGQPFYTQAVCQTLIDHLNDARTADASPEILDEVTRDLVENAPPQMIFLWENLGADDKPVFALLAEFLSSPSAFATAEDLLRLIRRRRYPLTLTEAQISTSLEHLFEREMLLKAEGSSPPRFAFRMDIWRSWVHRKHTVWQAMSEVGVDLEDYERRRERAHRRGILATRLAAIPVTALLVYRIFAPPAPPGEVRGADSWLSLDVTPSRAEISIQGRRVAFGSFHGRLDAGLTQEIRLSAAGHADSVFNLRPPPAETTAMAITLRPLLGDLRVITDPAGAEIRVDDALRGRSPLIVPSLPVPLAHNVEASLSGRPSVRTTSTLEPLTTTEVHLVFPSESAELTIRTDPPGASVLLAGAPAGTTPVRLPAIAVGVQSLQLRLAGYMPVDTQFTLVHGSTTIERPLKPLPRGILIIQGDNIASFFVDGHLVKENTQNSGPISLPPGTHEVRVVLLSGESKDKTLNVGSGTRVIYDFTNDSVKNADS